MSIEEKINQAQGAVKESVGKLSGNKKIEKEVKNNSYKISIKMLKRSDLHE